MLKNWAEFTQTLSSGPLKELRGATPEVMKNFSAMSQAALKTEALDTKTKELIALAIGVAIQCCGCHHGTRFYITR